jgi:hypothetical protein
MGNLRNLSTMPGWTWNPHSSWRLEIPIYLTRLPCERGLTNGLKLQNIYFAGKDRRIFR